MLDAQTRQTVSGIADGHPADLRAEADEPQDGICLVPPAVPGASPRSSS